MNINKNFYLIIYVFLLLIILSSINLFKLKKLINLFSNIHLIELWLVKKLFDNIYFARLW